MGALFGIRLGDVSEAKVDGRVVEIKRKSLPIMIENGPHELKNIGTCGSMEDRGGCFSGAAITQQQQSLP